MIKLEFKYNGRSIPSQDLGRTLAKDLTDKATKAAVTSLQSQIRSIRCSSHGSTAQLKPKPARKAGELAFDITGCCEELVDLVRKKMR
jgi:hypothetical protein